MSDNFGAPIDPNVIKSDEKLIALFSHLSLFFGGILLPIIFWAIYKDKSKFCAFHALQALWFHIVFVFGIIIISFFVLFGGIGMGMLTSGVNSTTMPVITIIAIIAFYVLLFLFIFGGIGYSIYMGIKAHEGRLNRYPVVGKIIYNHIFKL
jgi:uncharacterized protein